TRFDYATLATRLRELAFLNKGLTITLKDERKGSLKEETFIYKGGLAEFVKHLLGNRKALHPKPITFETEREGVQVEGAVQYDDVREGLTAVLHVKVKDPQFEGQTKTKLGNSEVEGIVKSVVNDALGDFFDKSPSVARTIIAKAVSAAGAREAARKARELVRKK